MPTDPNATSIAPWLFAGLMASLELVGMPMTAAAGCPSGYAKGQPGDTIRVGYTESPPLVMVGLDGAPRGPAIDMVRAVAEDAGWRLQLVGLGWESLRDRVRDCAVDLGVTGRPSSVELEATVDVSLPFLIDDITVATLGDPGSPPRSGALRVSGRAAAGAALAVAALAIGIWLVNGRARRRRGGLGLRWHRVDGAIAGPVSALRWLASCPGGLVLAGLWLVGGVLVGVALSRDRHGPPMLAIDPRAGMIAAVAGTDDLVGLRVPDGARVQCAARDGRTCLRELRDGTLAAVAGHRAALCLHARDIALDRMVLRDELVAPEQYGFLLPPGSPLVEPVNRALLRWHASAPHAAVACGPGGG